MHNWKVFDNVPETKQKTQPIILRMKKCHFFGIWFEKCGRCAKHDNPLLSVPLISQSMPQPGRRKQENIDLFNQNDLQMFFKQRAQIFLPESPHQEKLYIGWSQMDICPHFVTYPLYMKV